MTNRLIQSGKGFRRNPSLSFILSFFFTGLGQVYNGDLSKGVALFLMRILPLLLIPLYAFKGKPGTFLFFFTVFLSFHILFWLISSIEAVFSARRKRAFKPRQYNSLTFYSIFGLISTIFLFFSIMAVSLCVTVVKMDTDLMKPTFIKGDYLLINRYSDWKPAEGDAAAYYENGIKKFGRIISQGGDTAEYKRGHFIINGLALPFGVLNEKELNQTGTEDLEDIFFEINGNYKYTVLYNSAETPADGKFTKFKIMNGTFLFASDNRKRQPVYDLIKKENVAGRIEGIIFAKKMKRVFSPPYIRK